MQLVKISGENPNYKDALQGVWGYEGKETYFLTVSKGVGHLETPIADEETCLSIVLPSCYDFFAQINRENGCRFVRVTDGVLNCTLRTGEQINTNFKMK